ncbi:MAG: BolA/IbaG family iron-sulfur metabolism protein [Lentisphaeraceae bacterium]|nr:BolA/IbaG family iron-sulfur metabolism protein [Lentisphaeraceae bacterium]
MTEKGRQIKETIEAAVQSAEVHIYDPDGEHFEALVISPEFQGMPLIKQHKLVMNALKDRFATDVHALGLKTFTPEKWEKSKSNYM